MARLTVERIDYPWHIRAVDGALGLLDRAGSDLGNLDPENILAAARRQTGLSDFGDMSFLEPMRLVSDNTERLGFTHLARAASRGTWLKAAVNRLRLQEALRRDPTIAQTPVRRPIFVLGFPRSGTTLLQNLLAQVPSRRGLHLWELLTPLPVHTNPATDHARRRRTAQLILTAGKLVAPEMDDVHYIDPDTFEEDWYLFCNSFRVLNWDLMTGLEDYGGWLLDHDMTVAYAEYRTWLQVLLHQRPAEHLLLKCPEHLWFVDSLLKVFPDACIVWTHRDPVASIASYCSLMTLPRRMMYGHVEPKDLGRQIVDRFHAATERAMTALDAADRDRFYHVDFRRLLSEPRQVVHDICGHFNLEDPPDHDALLDAWLAAPRADERGKHVYSAERYGIDAGAVTERYQRYIQRFDLGTRRG